MNVLEQLRNSLSDRYEIEILQKLTVCHLYTSRYARARERPHNLYIGIGPRGERIVASDQDTVCFQLQIDVGGG